MENLVQVALTYDAAAAAGESPTMAVARRFHLSRSTAARRISAARERGLLPPAQPNRVVANSTVGEHRAVTAEVDRGRPGAFKVRICATCITRWPCKGDQGEVFWTGGEFLASLGG